MEHFILIVVYKDGKTKEFDFKDNLIEAERMEKVILQSCSTYIKTTYLVSRSE